MVCGRALFQMGEVIMLVTQLKMQNILGNIGVSIYVPASSKEGCDMEEHGLEIKRICLLYHLAMDLKNLFPGCFSQRKDSRIK